MGRRRPIAWWRRPATLAVLTWIGVGLTAMPTSVNWLSTLYDQYQNAKMNRVLDQIVASAETHAAIARYDAALATSLAKDEAWLAAHPEPPSDADLIEKFHKDADAGIAIGNAWRAAHPAR